MSEWFNKLGLTAYHPHLLKLPCIQSIQDDGVYIPHPSEPPILSRFEGKMNVLWMDWFHFIMTTGPDNGDNFNHLVHKCDIKNIEGIQSLASAIGKLVQIDITERSVILPERPPSISTTNGRYLSHAWVLDIARRDNMPIHEAVALGCSLIRQ